MCYPVFTKNLSMSSALECTLPKYNSFHRTSSLPLAFTFALSNSPFSAHFFSFPRLRSGISTRSLSFWFRREIFISIFIRSCWYCLGFLFCSCLSSRFWCRPRSGFRGRFISWFGCSSLFLLLRDLSAVLIMPQPFIVVYFVVMVSRNLFLRGGTIRPSSLTVGRFI